MLNVFEDKDSKGQKHNGSPVVISRTQKRSTPDPAEIKSLDTRTSAAKATNNGMICTIGISLLHFRVASSQDNNIPRQACSYGNRSPGTKTKAVTPAPSL